MSVAAVTGGGGRLGNALVRGLLEQGFSVRSLEPSAEPPALRGLEVERHTGSVLDPLAVAALVEGADVVFHTAARIDLTPDRDGSMREINVEGTRLVAEACLARGLRLVHTSSHAALVREPLSEPFDESRPLSLEDPCDYHRSKAEAEKLVLDLCARGLDATVVSPGTLTGPFDFAPSILGGALIDLFRRRLPALIEATTDYADVRDVAAAMIVAAERGKVGERYLLTGEVVEMRAMLEQVHAVTGVRMPRVVLPLWVGWAALPATRAIARLRRQPPLFSEGMLRAAVSNDEVRNDKARRELGFTLRSMRESLADAFAFYADAGML